MATPLSPQLQPTSPGEGPRGLHELDVLRPVAALVTLQQVHGAIEVAVVVIAAIEHDHQVGRLPPPQAHVLKVLHEAGEDLEAPGQRHDEVNGLHAFVLLHARPALPASHLLKKVKDVVSHRGLRQEDGVLLTHLDAQEPLLQVGVATHLHGHLATFVLAVDEKEVQDEVGADERVDAAVAVQDLLEVDGATSLPSVAVH